MKKGYFRAGNALKRVACALVACVLALSVCFAATACGGSADMTEDGRYIIRLAHWDAGGRDAEEAPLALIKEEFERTHPDYCLQYDIYSGYESQFLNIMGSGKIPDVFLVPDGDFGAWVTTGLMENLTPYIEASPNKEEIGEIFETAMERYRYDGTTIGEGNQYCMPKDIGPYVMYYNVDLFKEYGIYEEYKSYLEGTEVMDIETAIDMWSAFADLDAKGEPTANHIYGIDGITIEGLAWSNGADWFNEDRTELTLAGNKKLQEAYEMFRDLYDLKIAPDADSGAGITLFYNGKSACYVGLRANVPNLRTNCEFEWNCCAIPAFSTAPKVNSWSGSVGYGVYSGSKLKQAAYELCELIASKKGQLLMASTGFSIPFYGDEETLDAFYETESQGAPANTAAFIEAAKYQRANRLTYLPGSYRWKTQMDLEYESVSEDGMDVGLWLESMQTTIGNILKTDYPAIFG